MPIYTIELDGRRYRIEADTEDDAFAVLDEELDAANQQPEASQEGSGNGGLMALLAAGGALAGGLALRNPSMAKAAASKAFDVLQGARHLGALSGAAVPKSTIGNIGAPFVAAAERKSFEPIKQFFTKQTVKDYVRELRDPEAGIAWAERGAEPTLRMWNPFGRAMSAGDVATRKALMRAGATPSESARYTLQTPLSELGMHGDLVEALQSKPAQFAVLYRRTPLNLLVHGANAFNKHRNLALGAAGVGAVQGSAEGPVSDPFTVAMTAPAAGVYALPYLVGAGAGKLLSGTRGEAARMTRGLAPVPEDVGISVGEPLRPIEKPAAFSLIDRIRRLATTGKSY